MLAGSLVNGIVTVTIPEAYNGEFEFLVSWLTPTTAASARAPTFWQEGLTTLA
jgi:hypothetical protein